MSNILKSITAIFVATLALSSCTDNSDIAPVTDTDPQAATTEVPVHIEIGSTWNIDPDDGTRAAPPGAGDTNIDGSEGASDDDGQEEISEINEVRIITFRRVDNSDLSTASTTDDTPFVYDAQNDMRVTVTDANDKDYPDGDGFYDKTHKHLVADGTIKKTYGYEYRVIALAYNKDFAPAYPVNNALANDIDSWMKLNLGDGTTLDEFKAKFNRINIDSLLSNYRNSSSKVGNLASCTPQLFYGDCYAQGHTDSKIIKYSYDDNANVPLTGTLYRGMAKVELRVKLKHHNPTALIYHPIDAAYLAADNIYTEVGLYNYNCFNSASSLLDTKYYSPIGYNSNADKDGNEYTTISAWLLPGKTHLALRVYMSEAPSNIRYDMGQICTDDLISGDNATGVISPDAIGNMFYLRRNHKYVFTCNDSETILKHKL